MKTPMAYPGMNAGRIDTLNTISRSSPHSQSISMVLIILLSYKMNKFVSKNRTPIYASMMNRMMSDAAEPDISHKNEEPNTI